MSCKVHLSTKYSNDKNPSLAYTIKKDVRLVAVPEDWLIFHH